MDPKDFKTYDEQVNIFENRKFIIKDKEDFKSFLSKFNYYRVTGYILDFKKDDVYSNIDNEDLYEIYFFDEKIKSLFLKYITLFEVTLRTAVAYVFSEKHTGMGYLDENNFKKNSKEKLDEFNNQLDDYLKKNDDLVYKHHKEKYSGQVPLWVAVDYISFGNLSTFVSIMKKDDLNNVIEQYVPKESGRSLEIDSFKSYVLCIQELRNKCAHEDRLYRKKLTKTINKSYYINNVMDIFRIKDKQFDSTVFSCILAFKEMIENDKILYNCFINDFVKLLLDYPYANLSGYGFPKGWETILILDGELIKRLENNSLNIREKKKQWRDHLTF